MKRNLTRGRAQTCWHFVNGIKIPGVPAYLTGNVTWLTGDTTDIRGDVTWLSGDTTCLSGDVSGLSGDVTGLCGDVDDCGLTEADRKRGVDVGCLIREVA